MGRANCLFWGDDRSSAKEEAFSIYKSRAILGDVVAQSRLGTCFLTGQGIALDEKEALRWYRLAAAQGDAYAQFKLGACYASGKGVQEDKAEALRWFRRAAWHGTASDQNLVCNYNQPKVAGTDSSDRYCHQI